jgi:hypothetical protein
MFSLSDFLKRSLFFEISSFQVSSVYPWTSIPCLFALARSSSSVSPVMVCVQTCNNNTKSHPQPPLSFLQHLVLILLLISFTRSSFEIGFCKNISFLNAQYCCVVSSWSANCCSGSLKDS